MVEIRPVAAFGGGDAARAARAHAVVEVAVVFGVNGGAGGDARQYFGGRGFIASVAQAEAARRCGERGDDGKGAVLVGDDAARERGGEVGAAAALLYGKDGAVGGAVQGEQVGILAVQAVEQCGNGSGDGGGGAEAKSGVDVAVDGDIEAAGGRVLPQRGDEKAQLGMVGEGGEVGVMRGQRAFDMDFAVGAGADADADTLLNGADDGGRTIDDGVFAGNHDAAGGGGGEGFGHGLLLAEVGRIVANRALIFPA